MIIISHVKIIAFQTITNHSFWTFYIGGKPVVYIINRKIHGCLEIPDLVLVLNMIFLTRSRTRNKSGISAHPCIILYLFSSERWHGLQNDWKSSLRWTHAGGKIRMY